MQDQSPACRLVGASRIFPGDAEEIVGRFCGGARQRPALPSTYSREAPYFTFDMGLMEPHSGSVPGDVGSDTDTWPDIFRWLGRHGLARDERAVGHHGIWYQDAW